MNHQQIEHIEQTEQVEHVEQDELLNARTLNIRTVKRPVKAGFDDFEFLDLKVDFA